MVRAVDKADAMLTLPNAL